MEDDQDKLELFNYRNISQSSHLIYKELEKNIRLGRWELAKGYIFTVLSEGSTDIVTLSEVLRKVILNPYLVRSGPPIKSIYHFNWLICQFLESISKQTKVGVLKKDAEFRILIHDILSDKYQQTIKELCEWYTESITKSEIEVVNFSEDCLTVLRTLFIDDPRKIDYLFQKLIFSDKLHKVTNVQIYNIYLQSLSHCIKQLQQLLISSSLKGEDEKKKFVEKTLCILHLFPKFQEETEAKNLKQLLYDLAEICSANIVNMTDVYSALLCKTSPFLLQMFCEQHDKLFNRSNFNSVLSDSGSISVSSNSFFREMFLYSIKEKVHFLDSLIKTTSSLILDGDDNKAWNILQNSLLKRLQPLILILTWQNCTSDVTADHILDTIKIWKPDGFVDSLLLELIRKLQYNLQITDWCIEKLRLLYPVYDQTEFVYKRRNIFNQLLLQSPLRILHKTIGLKNISHDDVLSLLKYSQEEEKPSKDHADNLMLLSNSMVFHGYLVIMHIMDAIVSCCELEQLCFKLPDKSKRNFQIFKSYEEEPVLNDISTFEETNKNELSVKEFFSRYGAQATYSHFVTERLQKSKVELDEIFPISFRVEILEDIFSLLFVTSNDFQENVNSDSYDDLADDKPMEYQYESKYCDEVSGLNKTVSPDAVYKQLKNSIQTVKRKVSNSQKSNYVHKNKKFYHGISKSGFLCNELIVRDLLAMLKEAYLSANSAIYRSMAEKQIGVNNNKDQMEKANENAIENFSNLSLFIKTSVLESSVKQRLLELLKHINEAQWRFELVAPDAVPRELGMCGNILNRDTRISTFRKQDSFRLSDTEHLSSSSGRDELKAKRKLHRSASQKERLLFSESGFIHYMLASPTDLLCHSLWKQNYSQAKQVIQIFNLENTNEASEVYFDENYALSIKKIESLSKEKRNTVAKTNNSFTTKEIFMDSDQSSTVEVKRLLGLAKAADAGLQSTMMTSIIDEMLSLTSLPNIPDFVNIKESQNIHNILDECKEIHAIIFADFAYTSNTNLDIRRMLLQTSRKRFRSSITFSDSNLVETRKKHSLSVKGINKTAEKIEGLLQEMENFQKSEFLEFPSFLVPKIDLSCNFFIMLGSFNHKFYRDQISNWQNFSYVLNEVEELLKQDNREKEQTKEFVETNKVHISFKKLLKICSSQLQFLRINFSLGQKQRYFNFLKIMYDHMQHVSNALINCRNYDLNLTCYTNRSYFSVLKESPKDILSKMILQNGIPPTKLESFATEMKINLVHLLTQNCFPQILATSRKNALKQQSNTDSSYIILNTSENTPSSVRHPDVAVREILSDIINIIQDACTRANCQRNLTMSVVTSLIKTQEIKDWMASTNEIAHININLLNTKEDKIAFFGNLCNVMWLHAIFSELNTLQSKNDIEILRNNQLINIQPENTSSHIQILSSNIIERLICQKIFAYKVGELNTISLFDLRYNILHAGLSIPSHISSAVSLNRLFDCFEQPDIADFGIEPRLLFIICEGFISSPKLQILYSESVMDQLDKAMKDFLNFHVETSIESEKVILPQLLNWYSQDFVNYDSDDLSQANNEGLLTLVSSYMVGDTENHLESLLKLESLHGYSEYIDSFGKRILSFSVEFQPFSYDFGIIFDYDSITKSSSIKNSTMNNEKVDYYKISQQTHIIDYLKSKCWMLSDILAVMNLKNNSSISEESECEKLQMINLLHDTPLKRLLFYSLELWKKFFDEDSSINDVQWFIFAFSPYFDKEIVWTFLSSSLEKKDFQTLLEYLTIVETTNCCNDYNLFKDIILCYLSCQKVEDSSLAEPWSYALQIKNIERKVNCILPALYRWPDEISLKILKACLADKRIKMENKLYEKVRTKYEEVVFCQKVIQASSRVMKSKSKMPFNSWQDVAILIYENPRLILQSIKIAGQYQLAKEWEKIFPVTKEIREKLVEIHIFWLLDQNPPRMLEAEQILHSMETPEIGLSLCHELLKRSTQCENKLFFVHYIMENSKSTKNESDMESIKKLLIGLKIIKLIKERDRQQYEHLAYYPHLLLEQLLMNMEIEYAEKSIKLIHKHYTSKAVNDPLSPDNINILLENYAAKALEIFIVEDPVEIPSESDASSASNVPVQVEKFSIPLNVPKKEDWVPDENVRKCMVCQNEQFSMFNRRHHCRRCGRVVCKTCSQHRFPVEGYSSSTRVCDECFEQIYSGNFGNLTSSSLEQRLRFHLSGHSSSPKQFYIQKEYSTKRKTSLTSPPEIEKLTVNEIHNDVAREEFYYEQAPSVSLCLSILALQSDVKKCSFYILGLCNKLFNMLIPKRAGLPNPEIDYGLVISMIHSLLLNTKVKFSEANIAGGVEYVDTYVSFLDLIKQLVNENCVHFLPKDSITSCDAIRKLCNTLRTNEKIRLALEISTKYSINTFGIWATWGKIYLQVGDWNAAREKFSHCLKRPKDRNQSQNENALLKEIISILENSKSPPMEKNAAILKSINSLKSIQNGMINQVILKNDKLDNEILKECIYYLTYYGNHRSLINFYQKHNMLTEAISYIYKEKCDPEIFIENLFLPCAKLGLLIKLKSIILNSELKQVPKYLLSTCHYLEKNELFYLLYDLQLYMKDYIRAAMTSIKFYQEPNKDYANSKSQLIYLENAKKHLETYLKTHSNINNQQAKLSHKLSFPIDKVKKYIRRIQLQIDLSKYFKEWESRSELFLPTRVASDDKSSNSLPNILGDVKEKIKVAVMLILNNIDIRIGVDKSLIIVQEFNLNLVKVLILAAITLIDLKNPTKILQLIEYVNKSGIINIAESDDFISTCVETLADASVESDTVSIDMLIKLISSDIKKINTYIKCGKLKSAYLLAVKHSRASDIQRIMVIAEQTNQQYIFNICKYWLNSKKEKIGQT